MTHETKIEKGRDGWKAKTVILLPDVKAHSCHSRPDEAGDTRLTINTSKGRAGVSTSASVAFHGDHFTTHAMGLGTGLGDYGRTFLVSGDRCTERAVRRQHDEALLHVEALLVEVRAHYAAQEAKRAEEAKARAA